jgi:hypothetical protein
LTQTFENVPQNENVVAQVYMKRPLLIDNFKFDLRIYVLVSCVKPLRMYMFHDGLVRMCTEEYVKPTKQNLANSWMHLTNYAVNKTNSAFQQPTAKSSEDNQDEGSKRSLSWFMCWIRENWGDQKADRLWKRIGIITVRTLLTILPTLSRDYDQHFRSFNNVPLVRPDPPAAKAAGEGAAADGDGDAPEGAAEDSAGGPAVPSASGDGDAAAEENQDDSGGVGGVPGSSGEKLDKSLVYRGCRCFEILGLDIMIDSKLNPWMIEVNHLPR